MKIYEFSKQQSSAIQRLVLDDALSIATVTFQRASTGGKAYAYECSDIEAFQALVESTLQREESLGRLVNQALRDGTFSDAS